MIRAARPDDAAAFGAVLSAWIDETPWMPRLHPVSGERGFCARLIRTCSTWAAMGGPAPVGFAALEGPELCALYVHHSARRQGLGAALLGAVRTGRAHIQLWTFAANAPARAFYAAQGFTEIGGTAGENAEGLPDIRLEWRAP